MGSAAQAVAGVHAQCQDELNKRLDVLTDPVEDLGKAEFVPVHRAVNKHVSVLAFDLDVKAIAPQEISDEPGI